MDNKELENEIVKIKERNKKVELNRIFFINSFFKISKKCLGKE